MLSWWESNMADAVACACVSRFILGARRVSACTGPVSTFVSSVDTYYWVLTLNQPLRSRDLTKNKALAWHPPVYSLLWSQGSTKRTFMYFCTPTLSAAASKYHWESVRRWTSVFLITSPLYLILWSGFLLSVESNFFGFVLVCSVIGQQNLCHFLNQLGTKPTPPGGRGYSHIWAI